MQVGSQVPLPSQKCPLHSSSGSLPWGYGEQLPSFPAALQVTQVLVQVVSQQNPSVQNPLWHSPGALQVDPGGSSGRQVFVGSQ